MAARNGRRARHSKPRPGRIFVDVHGGALDGGKVRVRGFTSEQYHQLCGLARAGHIHAPIIARFMAAFWDAVGSPPADEPYTDDERVLFLRWIGAVPSDRWTPVDDLQLKQMLGGAV